MVGHLRSNIRSPGACPMAYGAVRDKSNPLPRYLADGARLAKSNPLSGYLASGGQAWGSLETLFGQNSIVPDAGAFRRNSI